MGLRVRIAALLLALGLLSTLPASATAPSIPAPITDWRPIDRAFHPLAYVPALRTSTGERGRDPIVSVPAHLSGIASWYAYVLGDAAAGPALRAWLGPDWRGQRVTVCAIRHSDIPTPCVVVTLSDFCRCQTNPDSVKVIDLDVRSFAQLADPSRGIVVVTIIH
jgi:hypothetical protein